MESFFKVWYLYTCKGLTYSLNLVCNVSQFKFKLIKLTMFWNQSVQINHLKPFSNMSTSTEHWVSKKEDVKEKKDWAVSTSLSQKKLRWSISWKLQTEFWISGGSCFCWSHLFSVVCTRARLAVLAHLSEALLGFYIGSILGSMSFYIQPLPQNST